MCGISGVIHTDQSPVDSKVLKSLLIEEMKDKF